MSESLFIESAARSASEEPQKAGEARANRLLAEARARIYHWPANFGGFACSLTLVKSDRTHQCGTLTAVSSRTMNLQGEFGEAPRWLRFQLEELLSHRESPEVSRMVNRTGALLGDSDPVYGQQVHLAGDSMGSFYRICDHRLTQIGRRYRGQDLLITIDSHHTFEDRFAAHSYTAFYRCLESGRLAKVETYLDRYRKVGHVHLPESRRVVAAGDNGVCATELRFVDHQLLPNSPMAQKGD